MHHTRHTWTPLAATHRAICRLTQGQLAALLFTLAIAVVALMSFCGLGT